MDTVVKILMDRDGMRQEDARAEVENFKKWVDEALVDGTDSQEIEDEFMSRFTLEPDYLLEVIGA